LRGGRGRRPALYSPVFMGIAGCNDSAEWTSGAMYSGAVARA